MSSQTTCLNTNPLHGIIWITGLSDLTEHQHHQNMHQIGPSQFYQSVSLALSPEDRTGQSNGWACRWLSVAQMARSVSGLTARGRWTSWRQATFGYANNHSLTPSLNTCGLCGEMTGWWRWRQTKSVNSVCVWTRVLQQVCELTVDDLDSLVVKRF